MRRSRPSIFPQEESNTYSRTSVAKSLANLWLQLGPSLPHVQPRADVGQTRSTVAKRAEFLPLPGAHAARERRQIGKDSERVAKRRNARSSDPLPRTLGEPEPSFDLLRSTLQQSPALAADRATRLGRVMMWWRYDGPVLHDPESPPREGAGGGDEVLEHDSKDDLRITARIARRIEGRLASRNGLRIHLVRRTRLPVGWIGVALVGPLRRRPTAFKQSSTLACRSVKPCVLHLKSSGGFGRRFTYFHISCVHGRLRCRGMNGQLVLSAAPAIGQTLRSCSKFTTIGGALNVRRSATLVHRWPKLGPRFHPKVGPSQARFCRIQRPRI